MDSEEVRSDQHFISSLKMATVSRSAMNLSSCAVRGTQDNIEALKRAVFNLKLERFLLKEKLRNTWVTPCPDDNSKHLIQSLKEQQLRYDCLVRELEDKCRELENKTVALKSAFAFIETHKEQDQRLKQKHKAESKKLRANVRFLRNKLKRKNEHLKLFRLRKNIETLKEQEKEKSATKSVRSVTSPAKSRFTLYRRNCYRIKVINMTTAASSPLDIADFPHARRHRGSDKILRNTLLLIILQWIVTRYNIKNEKDFHLEVIFKKNTLDEMAAHQRGEKKECLKAENHNGTSKVVCGKAAGTATIADAIDLRKSNAHETTASKFSAVNMIKFFFMLFGLVNPFRTS